MKLYFDSLPDAAALPAPVTTGHLGTEVKCGRCGSHEMHYEPDAMRGGGVDVCWSCGYRVRVRLTTTPPVEPPVTALSPEDIAALGMRAAPRAGGLTVKARTFAAAVPTDWYPVVQLGAELKISETSLSNLVSRAMTLGLIERDLRVLDWNTHKGRASGRRAVICIRRIDK